MKVVVAERGNQLWFTFPLKSLDQFNLESDGDFAALQTFIMRAFRETFPDGSVALKQDVAYMVACDMRRHPWWTKSQRPVDAEGIVFKTVKTWWRISRFVSGDGRIIEPDCLAGLKSTTESRVNPFDPVAKRTKIV